MGLAERLKAMWGKPAPVEADPWASPAPAAAAVPASNPWKPKVQAAMVPAPVENVWKSPQRIGKNWVLHKASFAVILVNLLIGLFFYSNNATFNAALLGYLGVSTILLAHYWGLTR